MKVKTFVVCAFAVTASSVGPAWATMPTGPQGTGAYGAPNAAVPLPQTVPPGYVYPAGTLNSTAAESTAAAVPDTSANRDLLADRTALDRDPPRTENPSAVRPARRWVHQGPSWATNPPAPPA